MIGNSIKGKVVVFIDAANIILAAQNLGFDLDMLRLIRHLSDSFRGARVIYFTANFKSKRGYFQTLAESDVELVYKQIYNEENKAKANCDVEIACRMTADILRKRASHVVLLSGDGDFAHLCDFARAEGIEVRVMAFDPKSCSRMIKRRQFTRVSFLVELGQLITKEKPPAGTQPARVFSD
jgi:uncharacterized LabA/DUF88 family protein